MSSNSKNNTLLSLTNDAVMKLFFAAKENEAQLRQFLKATTHLDDDDLMTIDIKDPKLTKQHVQEKDFIVDIRLTSTMGERINIEMQARNHDGFKERMVAYNARQYGSQLQRGEHYTKLKSSISLIITSFPMFDDTDEYYEHILFRRKNTKVFTKAQQFCILDLSKLPKEKFLKELMETRLLWGRLFTVKDEEELRMLMSQSEEMREAGEKLLKLSADEEAREIAQAREYSQWAWEHTLHVTEERGREEGRASGLQEGKIEMAISLLESGMSVEEVVKHSKLSLKDVENLVQKS